MSKSQPADKPTRRTIESFLRYDLSRDQWYNDPEYKELDEEMDRLVEQFNQTSRMRKLKSKRDAAYIKCRRKSQEKSDKITKLRRLYNTHGLTPQVIKEFQKLAKELNRE